MAELYPEIVSSDPKDDDQPSCSAAEALTRQEPFINQNLAYQALGMLTQLLRHGSLSYQGGFVNLETGWVMPLPIRAPERTSKPSRRGRKPQLNQPMQGLLPSQLPSRRGRLN